MKKPVKILFSSYYLKTFEIKVAAIPQIGSRIIFPPGYVKNHLGEVVKEYIYRVTGVDLVLNAELIGHYEISVTPD